MESTEAQIVQVAEAVNSVFGKEADSTLKYFTPDGAIHAANDAVSPELIFDAALWAKGYTGIIEKVIIREHAATGSTKDAELILVLFDVNTLTITQNSGVTLDTNTDIYNVLTHITIPAANYKNPPGNSDDAIAVKKPDDDENNIIVASEDSRALKGVLFCTGTPDWDASAELSVELKIKWLAN